MVQVSNSLLRRPAAQAEALIRQDLAKQMALAIDYAALRGLGNQNEPLGVANTPNILTSGDAPPSPASMPSLIWRRAWSRPTP